MKNRILILMQTEALLKEIGLSDKEIAVYLSLIELGPSPVRNVATHARINRGTTYDALKKLLEEGLVNYLDKSTHQYFVASQPEKIINLIKQKQDQLESLKQSAQDGLAELKLMFEKRGGKPVARFYEGPEGIRMILEDVLQTLEKSDDKIYYAYSSAGIRKNVYEAMPDFSKRRIKQEISVKTISLSEGGHLVGLDERKWMPTSKKDLKATYELIYGGKVAHISMDNSDNPVGIIISNLEIYETQKMIFEFNWSKL
ncbi:MAG: TrmB family transcriptional regulator [Candidatus Doudnabacteria bacterium]|nr:TrmB family transcriptional regulator [Candidatus Doudnabacteria bacterium]